MIAKLKPTKPICPIKKKSEVIDKILNNKMISIIKRKDFFITNNYILFDWKRVKKNGGEERIWTSAGIASPTPLAGAPLRPL
ncbi:MAG: hypothetical protein ACRC63_02705, partial [Metamycoplasmataceae bacterium]